MTTDIITDTRIKMDSDPVTFAEMRGVLIEIEYLKRTNLYLQMLLNYSPFQGIRDLMKSDEDQRIISMDQHQEWYAEHAKKLMDESK